MPSTKSLLFGAAIVLGCTLAVLAPHGAQANFVLNGGFESLGSGVTGPTQFSGGSMVQNWSVAAPPNSYAFLFFTSAGNGAFSHGATNTQFGGSLKLYGPDSQFVSPDGGNFVGVDGAFQPGAITQTVNGLTVGYQYKLTFDWAGAQQTGFDGSGPCVCTTDKWQVSLGSETHSTPVVTVANHGFNGWYQQTLTYTATSASEVLSFLAVGTPGSTQPPFALLDGVSLTDVPEPASAAVLLAGLAGLGLRAWRRRAARRDA